MRTTHHSTVSAQLLPLDEQEERANRARSDELPRVWSVAETVSDLPPPACEYQQSAAPSTEKSQGDVLVGCYDPQCGQHRSRARFEVEYLHWRLDGSQLLPLLTDGPATTPRADVAQLDDPDTVILSGDETVNDGWRNGYRLFGGAWFDRCSTIGIGADYFDIGNDDYGFVSPQDPTRVVGRPLFDAENGENSVQFISVPNELDGTVVAKSSDDFQGAGLAFNYVLWRCFDPCCRGNGSGLTLLSGYRYYRYDSNLGISESLTVLPATMTPLVPGTTISVHDRFRTDNEFNGGDIGLQAYAFRRGWWLDGMAKVAMGAQHRTVTIDGRTFVDVPSGGTSTATGGLLTSEITNIGRYDDSHFVFIPEFRLGAGATVTRHLSLRAGYNVIIWGDVARAASHLPPGLAVDPRNLPPIQPGGSPAPGLPGIRGSQLLAHGLDTSIIWQW